MAVFFCLVEDVFVWFVMFALSFKLWLNLGLLPVLFESFEEVDIPFLFFEPGMKLIYYSYFVYVPE